MIKYYFTLFTISQFGQVIVMYTVSVVGTHDVGKTTYCEKLIKMAQRDGFKVAALKSSKTSLDLQSTDTKRLMEAGADHVVFSSPHETAVFLRPNTLEEKIFERFHLYPDLLIVEGHKSGDYPKFLIARDKKDFDVKVKTETVRAVVAPTSLHNVARQMYSQALLLDWEDTEGLYKKLREMYVDYYVGKLPQKDCRKCGFDTCRDYANALKDDTAELGKCTRLEKGVRVSVDNMELGLSPYPRAVLSAVIRSLVETLSGVPVEYKRIDVLIEEP
jgi:molybdopterin-guanine dinucleotide biosynthesis protein B